MSDISSSLNLFRVIDIFWRVIALPPSLLYDDAPIMHLGGVLRENFMRLERAISQNFHTKEVVIRLQNHMELSEH